MNFECLRFINSKEELLCFDKETGKVIKRKDFFTLKTSYCFNNPGVEKLSRELRVSKECVQNAINKEYSSFEELKELIATCHKEEQEAIAIQKMKEQKIIESDKFVSSNLAFDENGVLVKISKTKTTGYFRKKWADEYGVPVSVIDKIVKNLKEGSTWEEFERPIKEYLDKRAERVLEEKKRAERLKEYLVASCDFDFIESEDGLHSIRCNVLLRDCTKQEVEEKQRKIFNEVIVSLEKNRKFQKYGIPVNVFNAKMTFNSKVPSLTVYMSLKV